MRGQPFKDFIVTHWGRAANACSHWAANRLPVSGADRQLEEARDLWCLACSGCQAEWENGGSFPERQAGPVSRGAFFPGWSRERSICKFANKLARLVARAKGYVFAFDKLTSGQKWTRGRERERDRSLGLHFGVAAVLL